MYSRINISIDGTILSKQINYEKLFYKLFC